MTAYNEILLRCNHIVAHLLKATTVEPEKQPLLANGSEFLRNGPGTNNGTMSVARQQILNKKIYQSHC
jgi:hypothetical protein